MLFSLFLVTFPNKLCVYSVFGGLTLAAPGGHLTIKFNSIKFNSLGLLVTESDFPNTRHHLITTLDVNVIGKQFKNFWIELTYSCDMRP